MKTQVIVKELEEVARQLGFGIRKGKGNFKGGRCIVSGDELIVLNKHHVPEMHLSVLAEGLRGLPVDQVDMKPAVRKALEDAWDSLTTNPNEQQDTETAATPASENDTPPETAETVDAATSSSAHIDES